LGSATSPVSLSLISGGWNVHAGNIYLNEVLNPNGVYNPFALGPGPRPTRIQHKFDYSADAFVMLHGDNSVQLLGSNPAHLNDSGDHPPIIYPPSLDIQAGAGGVVLGNDIILAPSPVGHLRIETTDGGSVRSSGYSQLVMSDSGSGDYKTWVAGHSATLLHSGDADPVSLIVAGNLENIFLRSAKRTDITVGGDAVNFTFEGQNLNPNDVSHITIAGNYTVGSDRASITLNDQPTLATFEHIFVDPLYVGNQELAGRLTYNPNTHTITLKNKMTETDLEFLLHPWVKTLDAAGNPITDAEGNFIKTFVTLTGDSQSLMTLFDRSQTDIPSPAALGGLQIGGPGSLALAARNMELGASRGIRSVGAFNNLFLPLDGASLTLDLQGDLKMTSSQIASFNGGNIKIDSQGKMNIGSQEQFSSDDTPKGIYTAHGGNVDVTSVGSIDLNGSRIATYDGGDIHIKTTGDNSDVNAGGGARGRFTVAALQRNSVNGKLETRNDQFFGSGIVALTRRDSGAQIGNITVSAKRDILASSGGVLQLAFNNSDLTRAHLDLNAGRDIIANRSGVLGANISLKAGRDIVGLIVGSENVNLDAVHNVAANVLGGGNVDVHGQSVSGSIVGGGAVGVSGSEISATVVSTSGNATTQGNLTGSVGGFANAAAPVAQQTTTETEKKNVAKTDDEDDEQKKKRAATGPVLAKTTGRVTVILPKEQ